MKLSQNEILILNVLQHYKKALERRTLISQTGISDKNISAKIKSLETKGLIITQKSQEGRFKKQMIELTKAGKRQKLVKIVIEKKIPKKEDVIEKYEKAKAKKMELTEEEKALVRIGREAYYPTRPEKKKLKEVTKRLHPGRMFYLVKSIKGYFSHVPLDTAPNKDKGVYFSKAMDYLDKVISDIEKKKEIKIPIIEPKITPKPLPASLEIKKEIRLLTNLVLTHRKEEYAKYGYKSVSEIRAQLDNLIDQLGR